jgi:LysR family cys regulon transcriptional activator
MNLRQLKALCEIVDNDFNLSKAAVALHTSQPSVSRQIDGLERELGIRVFSRSPKRITGLTKPGEEVLRVASKMSREADDLRQIGRDFGSKDTGDLTIAASNTLARYSLPQVIQQFTKSHPHVRLVLRQGDPAHITRLVSTGLADLVITAKPTVDPVTSAKPIESPSGVVFIPCSETNRVILTPRKHPLLKLARVSLQDLVKYPLITYDTSFEAYAQIMLPFEKKGLVPNIVLSATDVGVMKTYVKCGLGVAVVPSLAYDSSEDAALRYINATHLFGTNTIHVGVRKDNYLRSYVYDFIELFAPKLKRETIERAVLNAD